jgi:hypothetical protein
MRALSVFVFFFRVLLLLVLLLLLLLLCCILQPAPIPTSEEPLYFLWHSEVLDVSREAVPVDHTALQSVFQGVRVAEIYPSHEVREGRCVRDGEVNDWVIRRGGQKPWES